MKKWLLGILIALVVLGAAVYFGVPALVETGWAREKIRAGIEAKTGRETKVGGISFSWADGLVVSDVVVEQRPGEGAGEGPLLKFAELGVDVGFGELLNKTIDVEELVVRGPRIVIVRDQNGRFNFADLMAGPAAPPGPSAPPGPEEEAPAEEAPSGKGPRVLAEVDVEGGSILYIDEPLGTRVEATDLEADAAWNDGKLELELTGVVNGGEMKLVGTLDLTQTPAPFTAKEFTLSGARLATNLAALGHFLPLLGDSPQEASGTLRFSLRDVSGRGFTLADLERTLTGAASLHLEGGTLVSGPVAQLLSALAALGSGDPQAIAQAAGSASPQGLGVKLLDSNFSIRDGRIHTDAMRIDTGGFDLVLSGSTSLGGALDYRILVEELDELLKGNEEIGRYLGEDKKIPVVLAGSLSSPEVTVDVEGALKGAVERGLKEEIEKRLPGKLPEGLPFPR